jgi:uncharacterized protein
MNLLLNGVAVGVELQCAFTWPARAIGLLATRYLSPTSALWLRPCASVHTVGMAYPIDVVFLDREGQVKKIVNNLQPFRMAACGRADSVMEFGGGVAAQLRIQLGDQLKGAPGH